VKIRRGHAQRDAAESTLIRPTRKLHESSTCTAVHDKGLRGAITWCCRPAGRHMRYREDAKSAVGGGIAGGRSLGVSGHELPRRRFSIAVSTWRPTDIWYSRRYCTRRGSSSARWWVSGCCVFQTASCAASPTATRKSSSSMLPRSRHPSSIGNSPSEIGFSQLFSSAFRVLNACVVKMDPVNFLRSDNYRRLMTKPTDVTN
jgi:hypothetical protein